MYHLWDKVENFCAGGPATDNNNGACASHAGYLRLQIHSLKLHNTHCFSTTTMFARKRSYFSLYVHCLFIKFLQSVLLTWRSFEQQHPSKNQNRVSLTKPISTLLPWLKSFSPIGHPSVNFNFKTRFLCSSQSHHTNMTCIYVSQLVNGLHFVQIVNLSSKVNYSPVNILRYKSEKTCKKGIKLSPIYPLLHLHRFTFFH